MTQTLGQAISAIISIIASFFNMLFEMNYPAMTISLGSVLVGIMLIDLGFEYLNFFSKKDGSDYMRYKE